LEARALSYNRDHIDIYSASWGPDDNGQSVDGQSHVQYHDFRQKWHKIVDYDTKYGNPCTKTNLVCPKWSKIAQNNLHEIRIQLIRSLTMRAVFQALVL
jgi:hypothetical protein